MGEQESLMASSLSELAKLVIDAREITTQIRNSAKKVGAFEDMKACVETAPSNAPTAPTHLDRMYALKDSLSILVNDLSFINSNLIRIV
jgi:hypothetical protein